MMPTTSLDPSLVARSPKIGPRDRVTAGILNAGEIVRQVFRLREALPPLVAIIQIVIEGLMVLSDIDRLGRHGVAWKQFSRCLSGAT